MMPYFLFLRTD